MTLNHDISRECMINSVIEALGDPLAQQHNFAV